MKGSFSTVVPAMLLWALLALSCSRHGGVAEAFTLLDEWRPYYRLLYATPDGSSLTFDQTAANNASYIEACHVVYNASFYEEGWDYLHVAPTSALVQGQLNLSYYVAGYAEGFVTAANLSLAFAPDRRPALNDRMKDWMLAHVDYMLVLADDVAQQPVPDTPTTEYSMWTRVNCLIAQLRGIADGYNAAVAADPSLEAANSPPITTFDVFVLNFEPELIDVLWHVTPAGDLPEAPERQSSVFVRATADDLFAGHASWAPFETMLRVFKVYEFDVALTMSSYCGRISSGDDWYTISTLLAVQSSPMVIRNGALFEQNVQKYAISSFLRVMAANYLATDGSTWADAFEFNNSGTGNSQWTVVNMARFTPGTAGQPPTLANGTLWVVEQMPGAVAAADMTGLLNEQGYWAAYNIPLFSYVFDALGYADAEASEGTLWSYQHAPRARIFRERAPAMGNLADVQALLRDANFQMDPLSRIPNCTLALDGVCNPPYSSFLTIASRGDLNPYGGVERYGAAYRWLGQRDLGATDAKIASYSDLRQGLDGLRMGGHVICGPAHDSNFGVPAFNWTASNFSAKRPFGSPEVYRYRWRHYSYPYPPHGYYDGYVSGTLLVALLLSIVVIASAGIALLVRRKTAKDDVDAFTERLQFAKGPDGKYRPLNP